MTRTTTSTSIHLSHCVERRTRPHYVAIHPAMSSFTPPSVSSDAQRWNNTAHLQADDALPSPPPLQDHTLPSRRHQMALPHLRDNTIHAASAIRRPKTGWPCQSACANPLGRHLGLPEGSIKGVTGCCFVLAYLQQMMGGGKGG